MNTNQILQNIQKHISLSEEEKKYFISVLEMSSVNKRQIILRQGQRCQKLYFVESGSLRAYNINDDGKESTIMFAIQDWWITDMNAFINQKPPLLSIETIQESSLVYIDFKTLEDLYIEIPKFERFFRIIFQNAYIREQLKVLDNISSTTEQRYLKFVDRYPKMLEKITQKQIASYLGVTPEFLSAIKKNRSS